MTPQLEVKIDVVMSQNAKVLRVQTAKGLDIPYALDGSKFYVRDEAETDLAVRDEIVALVREALGFEAEHDEPPPAPVKQTPAKPVERGGGRQQGAQRNGSTPKHSSAKSVAPAPAAKIEGAPAPPPVTDTTFYLPQVGVEIVDSDERNGHRFYTIRDLRNGHVIKNVTRKGARKLWNYAIQQVEDSPVDPAKIQWRENTGFVRVERRAGKSRYDLALREGDALRIFYGVTDDGMEGAWAQFVQEE
jgi:hypothetical protein